MHIDIEFSGAVDLIAEEYMTTLDAIEAWAQVQQIEISMGYADNILTVTLPSREDYGLWVMTYKSPYRLDCSGYER